MNLKFENSFTDSLPADLNQENTRRQVHNASYSWVKPTTPSDPKLIHVSEEVLAELGISIKQSKTKEFLELFSGAQLSDDMKPFAMNYGGHQFGQWSGQLGDGRAINLGEIRHQNRLWNLQLKGAGETPYSRRGDGYAVLRSSVREHLCSEAMYHLGVPTTRSLSLMLTGDQVLRDVMYDGNPAYEKGAIVCRVAQSFIRFGNFQLHAARKEHDTLKILADYVIATYYPENTQSGKDKYLTFFKEVLDRTLEMIVHWQRVGFVHGVMNTDNLSILGQTIDYGPYGWLEGYDHHWTPNTTDVHGKRYRFGHQPKIGLWNLLQLANALYPLVKDPKPLEDILHSYNSSFAKKYANMMCDKLGLTKYKNGDNELFQSLEETLHAEETDMTIFFRLLANVSENNTTDEAIESIANAFYNEVRNPDSLTKWSNWFSNYIHRLKSNSLSNKERISKMNSVNPKYVLRNYMAQLAIDEANKGNYTLIHELYTLLKRPYDEKPEFEKWFAKRPEWARHKVGCSMLSCSS